MPYAIGYACSVGGCRHRSPCPTHGGRRPEQLGYYSTKEWRRLRTAQLQREPWCRAHLMRGEVVAAVVADHVIPRRRGGADDLSNLQSLCRSCDARKRNGERDEPDSRWQARS
jgi:5-methylcytosine-specific restriction endonuclease McrA